MCSGPSGLDGACRLKNFGIDFTVLCIVGIVSSAGEGSQMFRF
jgi:hypothetical protein